MNHVPDIQMSPHLAALRCLFLLGLHHGVQIAPERLAHADDADTVGSILRIMREVGLRGKLVKNRTWDDLVSLGSAYPVMAERKSGTWVIVASTVPASDGSTGIAVLDPVVEHSGIAL